MGSRIRLLLNQSIQDRVANSTSSALFQGPSLRMTSVLYRPLIVSAIALSYESPRLPTQALNPASDKRSE